jgi:polyketide synthase PksJ
MPTTVDVSSWMESRDIERQLAHHPCVKEAVVAPSAQGQPQLLACIVPDFGQLRALAQAGGQAVTKQVIERWNKLYELSYATGPAAPVFAGWNSSYTRKPIPEEQMREWLGTTVDRIRALAPQRVLEIGCGVGLVLEQLAPQCSSYVATDFSKSALARLGQWLGQRPDLKHVELLHRSAAELHDLPSGAFDTVVLNSVVQYFPDITYLVEVLREAVRLTGEGGHVFVGDIRNCRLLTHFHSAVQLFRANAETTVEQLRASIVRAVSQEAELLLDPEFFLTLPARQPGVAAVEVQLRRGNAQNELTRYRYDSVLKIGARTPDHPAYTTYWWHPSDDLAQLGSAMSAAGASPVHLRSIKNRRLSKDAAARILIESAEDKLTAGELRDRLHRVDCGGVDPEWLWEWGVGHGYEVKVGWGPHESAEDFEVYLSKRNSPGWVDKSPLPAIVPLDKYANNPLENGIGQQFVQQLHEYVRTRLPHIRIPLVWISLRKLPRLSDGQVDRRALGLPLSRPTML